LRRAGPHRGRPPAARVERPDRGRRRPRLRFRHHRDAAPCVPAPRQRDAGGLSRALPPPVPTRPTDPRTRRLSAPTTRSPSMQIVFALYDQFTALDIIGPFTVLAYGPSVQPVFVAATADPVAADVGTPRLLPDLTFEQCPSPDVVVVP